MRLYRYLRSFFPRKFPVGVTEFHEWSDRIIALSGKYADEDSMKWALASSLLHMASGVASKPDKYFVALMRKAAANQVVSQVIQDIKTKQAEQMAKQSAEATAQPEQTSNDQQTSNQTNPV